MYVINHRQNVMRGLAYNAEKALYNGRKILGYTGKTDQKYEIDEETAPVVRRIFQEYAEGRPMQKICDGLNGAGLRSVRGNRFTVNSMHRILTNWAYIGEYHFGEFVIPNGMPRLIDDEVFLAVQAKLEANKRGGKGAIKKMNPEAAIEDYWLTGKIRCGLCGGTLQGVSGTSHTGATHYYYSCKNHRKHACKLKNQRKELMETIVLYLLGDLLRDPAFRILIADACYAYHMAQNDDNGAYEASIRSELKEVEGKLANLLKALEAGIFNDTTAERMKELESRKSMLDDALLAERNRKKFALKHSDILRFLDGFVGDLNKPGTRRSLLDGLIDNIYVYPDKLAVACFFSDDRRELPFEETAKLIESSKAIRSLDYLQSVPEKVSEMVRQSLLEGDEGGDESLDETEEDPDFFP